jgi:hypothetical protein
LFLGLLFITNSEQRDGKKSSRPSLFNRFFIIKRLLSLVMIAFIIATPLAWLAMSNWLQDFAYRTNISCGYLLPAASAC